MDIHAGETTDTRGVSQDMEEIFGATNHRPAGPPPPRSHAIVPIVARSPKSSARLEPKRSLVMPGAALAAALAVAVALAQVGGTHRPPASNTEPPASQLLGAAPAPPPARPAAMVSLAAVEPAVEATSLAKPQLNPASYSPSPKTVKRHRTSAAKARAGRACGRLYRSALARCMRPQILRADRQLRTAYHRAARAGVEREVLVAYRDRWSSLRRRANADPRHVVVSYRRMTQQLHAARTGRHAGDI